MSQNIWRWDAVSLLFNWSKVQEKDHGQDVGKKIEVRNQYQLDYRLVMTKESSPMMMVYTGNTSNLRWSGGW
jgi:hypothetical protein